MMSITYHMSNVWTSHDGSAETLLRSAADLGEKFDAFGRALVAFIWMVFSIVASWMLWRCIHGSWCLRPSLVSVPGRYDCIQSPNIQHENPVKCNTKRPATV